MKETCFGPSAPEKGWVPAPRYALRRRRVMRMIRAHPRGRLLEIGCGAAALLYDLSALGFECWAVEQSPAAREVAHYINRDVSGVRIYDHILNEWKESFDCVMAFEVLEHIENDRQALEQWAACLKSGGTLLISVPAHPKRWSVSDVWAGHFRRYDRQGFGRLLENAGFSVVLWECYGFPLTNITDPIRAFHHSRLLRKRAQRTNLEDLRREGNDLSGVERSLECRLFPLQASWAGRQVMRFFSLLQDLFIHTDLGDGYLVLARRNR